MSFQNIYYKRTTATSRTCYVCNKPTTVCLATSDAVDFLYTCEAHLSDTGFATELVDPSIAASVPAPASASSNATAAAVSPEEIARVKAEWEAKEAREKAKEKGNGKSSAEGKEKEEGEEGGDGKKKAKSPSPSIPGGVSSSPTGSSAAATPTHKRYSLYRDFYAMRQAEHRRKRQAKQMQELAPRLPGAPEGPP